MTEKQQIDHLYDLIAYQQDEVQEKENKVANLFLEIAEGKERYMRYQAQLRYLKVMEGQSVDSSNVIPHPDGGRWLPIRTHTIEILANVSYLHDCAKRKNGAMVAYKYRAYCQMLDVMNSIDKEVYYGARTKQSNRKDGIPHFMTYVNGMDPISRKLKVTHVLVNNQKKD